MSQRDSVDDLIDTFGTHLEQADRRADRARRPIRLRRIALAGGGLAVAGSAAALVIGIGGGSKLDVVSEARAALAPEGSILHMKIAFGRPGQPDDPDAREIQESWSATDPTRWKFAQTMPVWVYSHGKGRQTDKQQTQEFAYAAGTMSNYDLRRNALDTVAGYDASSPAAVPVTWRGMPAGEDPTASLRSMLSSGQLSSAGSAKLGDRSVLRLRGTSQAHMDRGIAAQPVEYDVDATTFKPVRMVLTNTSGDEPDVTISRTTIWFRTFEQLPLTATNEALLTVHPNADTTLTRYTVRAKGQPCPGTDKRTALCKA